MKILFALLLAFAVPAFASPQRIALASVNPDASAQTLRGWWLPANKPDAPAVIALHGCGGLYGKDGALNARHRAAGEFLNANGFAVLFPDSLTDRGLKTLCTIKFSERTLKQKDRLQDVAAAVRWLAANTQATRLLLLGWSHGGGVTLAAMDTRSTLPELSRLQKAIAFYPGCTAYAKRGDYTPRAPLLIQIGQDDDWTPAAPCAELDGKGAGENRVKTIVYPGAVHDFDSPNAPLRRRMDVPNGVHPGKGVMVGGNPEARTAAYAQMLRFFEEK
ncbi:MAG: dienelactone hydrolase family protein [Burkholderiaceae bacterium]